MRSLIFDINKNKDVEDDIIVFNDPRYFDIILYFLKMEEKKKNSKLE